MPERIAIIGLGHVGLPVALGFARKFPDVVAFDIDADRIAELRRGIDRNREQPSPVLKDTNLRFTSSPTDLPGRTFFVVASVAAKQVPDLTPLKQASVLVGKALSPGAIVVYESTVYPGVTEDVCGTILEAESGLRRGVDFKLGYSPERINQGDPDHVLEKVTKVVSGEDAEALERIAAVYAAIIDAGVHRAPSIKVAEAAKVIENTQRDLNVALMNELAILFDRMGVRTSDVLAAAGTKWNFPQFKPGLVGGHSIGVDPQYLSMKAQQLGYQPEVILAGRRINDSMGSYVAQKVVKLLIDADIKLKGARVGILGLTFKEDCSDLRNSKVPGIQHEFREFGIDARVHDPLTSPAEAFREHGIKLTALEEMTHLDALVLAVGHRAYLDLGQERLCSMVRDGGVLVDVKSVIDWTRVGRGIHYWSL